jgi:outer membrane receptor protein involved in Fe transport
LRFIWGPPWGQNTRKSHILHGSDYGGTVIAATPQLTIGGEIIYNSGQFLRGDEANLLDETDSYAIINLRGEYTFNKHLTVFAKVENLFDVEYETFGLLGEPEEILGPHLTIPAFSDPVPREVPG